MLFEKGGDRYQTVKIVSSKSAFETLCSFKFNAEASKGIKANDVNIVCAKSPGTIIKLKLRLQV